MRPDAPRISLRRDHLQDDLTRVLAMYGRLMKIDIAPAFWPAAASLLLEMVIHGAKRVMLAPPNTEVRFSRCSVSKGLIPAPEPGCTAHGVIRGNPPDMSIRVGTDQTPHRAWVAYVHEVLHAAERLSDTKMDHLHLHHLAVALAGDLRPLVKEFAHV